MMHHLLELILWLLAAFIIGWIIGWFVQCVLLRGGRPRDGYVEQPRQTGQHAVASGALAGGAVALAGGAAATASTSSRDGMASAAVGDENKRGAEVIGSSAEKVEADAEGRGEAGDDTGGGAGSAEDGKETADGARVAAASVASASAVSAETSKALPAHGLSTPVGGKADDLQMISGIGPKLEKLLHELGIYHFAQIASWTKKDIEEVDSKLKFKGRIEREEWVRQAKLLAAGKFEQFEKEYGTGGKKGADGKARSGTRTRKK